MSSSRTVSTSRIEQPVRDLIGSSAPSLPEIGSQNPRLSGGGYSTTIRAAHSHTIAGILAQLHQPKGTLPRTGLCLLRMYQISRFDTMRILIKNGQGGHPLVSI